MHGVNIFLVLPQFCDNYTPRSGMGVRSSLLYYVFLYYLLFYAKCCPYDSFSSIRTVRYFSSSCLFVCYITLVLCLLYTGLFQLLLDIVCV